MPTLAIKPTIEKTFGYDFPTLPLRIRANSSRSECYRNEINKSCMNIIGMKELGMKNNMKISELSKRLDK